MLHRCLATLLVLAGCSSEAEASPALAKSSCPEGTTGKSPTCTLSQDLALDHTLDVPAGITLDCGGRRIVPGPKPPLVAIVVHDGAGTTVTRCRIEGFEQGIYVLRTTGRNDITANVIVARVKGVALWGTIDTRVEGNDITVSSGYGAGIGLSRGSKGSLVRGNTVKELGGPADEQAPADFPEDPISSSPPAPPPAVAIFVGSGGIDNALIQFTLDRNLYQFPSVDDSGVEGNTVEGNSVSAVGLPAISTTSRNQGTVVRGNVVTAAGDAAHRSKGINVGAGSKGARTVAATCVQQPARYCLVDLDCNGRLKGDPPNDRCAAAPTVYDSGDYTSHHVTVADNTVGGPGLSVGIDAGAVLMTITGNRVTGAAGAGLSLGKAPLADAWVELNVLADNGVGLNLAAAVTAAGLVFTHNDVTGAGPAIGAPATWSARLELSKAGQGNYWGGVCPAAFPGAPSPLITDSFPYGQAVAAPAGDTPSPCAP